MVNEQAKYLRELSRSAQPQGRSTEELRHVAILLDGLEAFSKVGPVEFCGSIDVRTGGESWGKIYLIGGEATFIEGDLEED